MSDTAKPKSPPQASPPVHDAVERMFKAGPLFTKAERHALVTYEGPIVSGDPEGRIPENLEMDDDD